MSKANEPTYNACGFSNRQKLVILSIYVVESKL